MYGYVYYKYIYFIYSNINDRFAVYLLIKSLTCIGKSTAKSKDFYYDIKYPTTTSEFYSLFRETNK